MERHPSSVSTRKGSGGSRYLCEKFLAVPGLTEPKLNHVSEIRKVAELFSWLLRSLLLLYGTIERLSFFFLSVPSETDCMCEYRRGRGKKKRKGSGGAPTSSLDPDGKVQNRMFRRAASRSPTRFFFFYLIIDRDFMEGTKEGKEGVYVCNITALSSELQKHIYPQTNANDVDGKQFSSSLCMQQSIIEIET